MPDQYNTGNGLVRVEDPRGVWALFDHDHGPCVMSLHLDEIDALRASQQAGHGKVAFVPFGADFAETVA